MAIRIRVYPQPNSIGARRRRAAQAQRQQLLRQQAQLQRQQELLRQQQLQISMGYGGFQAGFQGASYGGYATSPFGSFGSYGAYGTPYGSYAPAYGSAGTFALPIQYSGLGAGAFDPFIGSGLISRYGGAC